MMPLGHRCFPLSKLHQNRSSSIGPARIRTRPHHCPIRVIRAQATSGSRTDHCSCCSQFTVHSSRFTVHSSQFTVHGARCTVHGARFAVRCSMFDVRSQSRLFNHRPARPAVRSIHFLQCVRSSVAFVLRVLFAVVRPQFLLIARSESQPPDCEHHTHWPTAVKTNLSSRHRKDSSVTTCESVPARHIGAVTPSSIACQHRGQ